MYKSTRICSEVFNDEVEVYFADGKKIYSEFVKTDSLYDRPVVQRKD